AWLPQEIDTLAAGRPPHPKRRPTLSGRGQSLAAPGRGTPRAHARGPRRIFDPSVEKARQARDVENGPNQGKPRRLGRHVVQPRRQRATAGEAAASSQTSILVRYRTCRRRQRDLEVTV